MRTSTLMLATVTAGALTLGAGIAVGVAIPDAAQSVTAETPAREIVTIPDTTAAVHAAVLDACTWDQVEHYLPRMSAQDAYVQARSNCDVSARTYGWAQLITRYGTGE